MNFNFLLDLPPFLLIALGLAIVNGIKFVIEKYQERRGGGQFNWPDPDEDTEWKAPQNYEPPSPPQPVSTQRRAPQRHASVPPPITSPEQTAPPIKAEPAWNTGQTIQSQDVLKRTIQKPALSRAEQEALSRLKKRGNRRKSRRSTGSSILDLSEREFLRTQLRNPRSARHAITLAEVLGPPVSLRK